MTRYYEAETPVADGLANAAAETGIDPPYYNPATGAEQQTTDSTDNTALLWYVLAFALGFTAAKIIK